MTTITQGLDDTTRLGRFQHHPDPATDFGIEVEKLESRLDQAQRGMAKPGQAPETRTQILTAIQNAMSFQVGGDAGAVDAKALLRSLEDRAVSRWDRGPYPENMGALNVSTLLQAAYSLDRCASGHMHPWATEIYAVLDECVRLTGESDALRAEAWNEGYNARCDDENRNPEHPSENPYAAP